MKNLGKTQLMQIKEKYGDFGLDMFMAAAQGTQGQPLRQRGAVSATASQNYLHGPGSLLGILGLQTPMFSSQVLPLKGLQAELPYYRNDFEEQILSIFTGITASTGSEPTSNCADGKQPGQMKICSQVWPYGRIQMDSQVLDVSMAGRLINRGEFVDMSIVGNPFGNMLPTPPVSPNNALKDEVSKKLIEMFARLFMDYGHLAFDGNPVNTLASSGGYIEYQGLDRIINTGYIDAMTGIPCPGADAKVENFGSVTMDANAQLLVSFISQLVRYLNYYSERSGNGTLQDGRYSLALVMRYSAFLKLTEVWPCAYFTTLCTASMLGGASSGSTNFVEAQRQIELRNEMRKGSYVLTVFGDQVPVIIDDFITETIPVSGTMQSDIYFVPLTASGQPVTYWEYFNFAGPGAAVEMGNMMALPGTFTITGDGQWLMVKKPVTNTCVQVEAIAKKRLICRTPFLGARLTNTRYTVIEHEKDFIGATPASTYGYQPDGGTYYFGAPYFYPSPK